MPVIRWVGGWGHYLFTLWMQLPVDKDASVEILLRPKTELPVLLEHLLVECVDGGKLVIRGIMGPIDFILNPRLGGAHWNHALDIKEVLRNRHRRRREEKGDGPFEFVFVATTLLVDDFMLQASTARRHSVLGQIRHARNQWVRRRTVVALVVIVNDALPVGLELHVPHVVVDVAARKVEVLHPRLVVDAAKVVLPLDVGLSCLEVDPDEACRINPNVDRQKPVLALVEPFYRVESRSLGEVAFEAVGPAVVFAAENAGFAGALLHNRVRAVSTDIVEAVDVALAVLDQEEGEIGVHKRDVLARLLEPEVMRDEYPFSGNDGSSLQLVQFRRSIPRSW